jgi:hypothetical protein
VKSRPGAARTILLFDIISARPSKQPRMVGSTLGVYSFGLIFVPARTNKRYHHHDLRPGRRSSSCMRLWALRMLTLLVKLPLQSPNKREGRGARGSSGAIARAGNISNETCMRENGARGSWPSVELSLQWGAWKLGVFLSELIDAQSEDRSQATNLLTQVHRGP